MNPCEVYLALSAACPKEPSTPRHNSTIPQLPQRNSAIFCWKKRGLRVFLAKHMASEEGIASEDALRYTRFGHIGEISQT